jgi:hypothetical protein
MVSRLVNRMQSRRLIPAEKLNLLQERSIKVFRPWLYLCPASLSTRAGLGTSTG